MKILRGSFFSFLAVAAAACSASSEGGSAVDRSLNPTTPGGGAMFEDPGVGGSAPAGTGTPATGQFGDVTGGNDTPADVNGDGVVDCGQEEFVVERRPAEVLLVLDRSASMQDGVDDSLGSATNPSKWSLTLPAITQVIQATDVDVAWGLKVFPEGSGNLCQATSVTGNVVRDIAASNAATVVADINATQPAGDGTPTGAAIYTALDYMRTRQSPNPNQFIVLATDGEPSCGALPSDESQTEARPYATQAVTEAAAAGFPVFVVGVATTKDTATTVLNDLALAGGVPVPNLNPAATLFYLGSSTADLVSIFQQITGQIASCTFTLAGPPPVPENIGVRVNGSLLPNDMTQVEGWAYTTTDNTVVQVFGSFCEQIRTLPSNAVSIVFGCPGVLIE